jgi:hypothetical protein
MYDENAPKLIENGYHSHPIAPVGFEPPKVPVRYEPSLNRHVMYKGWTEAATPLTSPQPGRYWIANVATVSLDERRKLLRHSPDRTVTVTA